PWKTSRTRGDPSPACFATGGISESMLAAQSVRPRAEHPLRLLTLVQKGEGIAPHQRFRHEQWAPWLAAEHQIRLEFAPFESAELTRVLYERGRAPRKALLTLRDALRRWAVRHRVTEFDGVV